VHDSAEGELTRRGYDTVAREYATEIADELAGKPLDRAVLDVVVELAAGGPIADIGCGPGHVAAHLADRGASVVGVDLSEAMCALASRATSLPSCVADMTALPIRSQSLAAIVTLYSVIHLNTPGRAAAYQEFARTLRTGGHALIAFHTSDADVRMGGRRTLTDWWGHQVELVFRFLDPAEEIVLLAKAGLVLTARLDREPEPGIEHSSRRTYLLARRRYRR
jgi:SAM-dependent methyltransferase